MGRDKLSSCLSALPGDCPLKRNGELVGLPVEPILSFVEFEPVWAEREIPELAGVVCGRRLSDVRDFFA